jgi:hypothetical protein
MSGSRRILGHNVDTAKKIVTDFPFVDGRVPRGFGWRRWELPTGLDLAYKFDEEVVYTESGRQEFHPTWMRVPRGGPAHVGEEPSLLVWPKHQTQRKPVQIRRGREDHVFIEFLNLREATAEKVLDFAGRYGTLNWNPRFDEDQSEFDRILLIKICDPRTREGELCWGESLNEWRQRARWMLAILKISEELQYGRAASPASWSELWAARDLRQRLGRDLREQRERLADHLNEELALSTFSMCLELNPDPNLGSYRFAPEAKDLRSFLLARLMNFLGGSPLKQCDGCKKWYPPKRAKNWRHRRTFCEECGPKESWKLSKRAGREARRAAATARATDKENH